MSLSFRRRSDLGNVNWAFVITLVLLLGFVFLWFQAADERDKAKEETQKTKDAYKEVNAQIETGGLDFLDVNQVLGDIARRLLDARVERLGFQVLSNLVDEAWLTDNQQVLEPLPIAARGKIT